MTALDQAFIKAFSHQDPVPLALAPRPVAPKRKEKVASGPWPVASEPPGNEDQCVLSDDVAIVMEPVLSGSALTSESIEAFATAPMPTLEEVWTELEQKVEGGRGKAEGGGRRAEEAASLSVLENREPEIPTLPPSALHPPPSSNPQSLIPNPLSPLKPAWQVDHFSWPKLCGRLADRAGKELDCLADALQAAGDKGQKVLGLGGRRRGEGATTLLLCAAQRLAQRGLKPILVDADLDQPRLAKRLGVQPQLGWDATTDEEGRTLDQAVVEATGESVSLLAAREPSLAGDPARLPDCLRILREHYDLILVDLGPLEGIGANDDRRGLTAPGVIDAVVLVQNRRLTSEEEQREIERRWTSAGIAVAGIVENFVAEG